MFNFRNGIVRHIKVGNFRTRSHKRCDTIQIVLDFEDWGYHSLTCHTIVFVSGEGGGVEIVLILFNYLW